MRRRGWEIPERLATPEALVLRRRGVLAGALALTAGAASRDPPLRRPTHRPVPHRRAPGSRSRAPPGRATTNTRPAAPITEEKYATTYNNYYEFDDGKNALAGGAEDASSGPWSISIGGMVSQAAHHRHR